MTSYAYCVPVVPRLKEALPHLAPSSTSGHPVLTVVLLLLLAGALVADHDACTSGSYMDPKLGYMSFRLYDMPTSYLNNMAYVAAGTRMSLLPVTGRKYSSLGSSIRVKNNFVCLSPSTSLLEVAMALFTTWCETTPAVPLSSSTADQPLVRLATCSGMKMVLTPPTRAPLPPTLCGWSKSATTTVSTFMVSGRWQLTAAAALSRSFVSTYSAQIVEALEPSLQAWHVCSSTANVLAGPFLSKPAVLSRAQEVVLDVHVPCFHGVES